HDSVRLEVAIGQAVAAASATPFAGASLDDLRMVRPRAGQESVPAEVAVNGFVQSLRRNDFGHVAPLQSHEPILIRPPTAPLPVDQVEEVRNPPLQTCWIRPQVELLRHVEGRRLAGPRVPRRAGLPFRARLWPRPPEACPVLSLLFLLLPRPFAG